MNRILSRVALALAVGLVALSPPAVEAQTTFTACRVPDVGAIYMIGVSGAPSACLDASHVEFSWTEGGALATGSVTSDLILDGTIATVDIGADAVTSAQVAPNTLTRVDIADDAITTLELDDNAVGSANIIDASVTAADLAPNSVTASEIAAGAVGSSELGAGLFQWATVTAAGTVLGSSGGVSGTLVSTGIYRLTFTQTLGGQTNCALLATAADGAHIIQTVHGQRVGQGDNVLQVNLYNASGAAVNGGFVAAAICN